MFTETVLILRDESNNVVEVFKGADKEIVKKLLPHIEAKLLVSIQYVDEYPLNPSIDLAGNPNFKTRKTVVEFLK